MNLRAFSVAGASLFVLLFTCLPASAQSSPLTVCSMTFNSDDEIQTLKTRLVKEMGQGQVEFIEVLNYLGKDGSQVRNTEKWLPRACQALKRNNKKCDVLVISGHFGGAFFGDKISVSMPLEMMEEASCQADCANLFQSPKEVYLFGCNTLAGKEPDRRTLLEYIQALMEHGLTEGEARRTALFRYSDFGDSNRNRMSRVFQKTPLIYGFNSIAPLGADISPNINQFFNSIKTYVENRSQSLASGTNEKLAAAMTDTAFTQAKGRNVQTQLSDRLQTLTCGISNGQPAAIQQYVSLAKKDQFVELFPMILDFTWKSSDLNLLSPLASLNNASEFKAYVQSLGKFFKEDIAMNLRLLRYAYISKWMTQEEMVDRYHELHLQAFNQDWLTDETTQAFAHFKPRIQLKNGLSYYAKLYPGWASSTSHHAELIARTAPPSLDTLTVFMKNNNFEAAVEHVAQTPQFFKNYILQRVPNLTYRRDKNGFNLLSLFATIAPAMTAAELKAGFGSIADSDSAAAVAEDLGDQTRLTRENYLGILSMLKDLNFYYREEATIALTTGLIIYQGVTESEILNDILPLFLNEGYAINSFSVNIGISLVEVGYRTPEMKKFFRQVQKYSDFSEVADEVLHLYF